MKVHYTGAKPEISPVQQKKIAAEFAKLGKIIDRGGEKDAHVIFSHERHLTKAEITVHYLHHPLVAACSEANGGTALVAALKKFETQLIKTQAKFRETKIRPAMKASGGPASERVEPAPKAPAARIRKVTLRKGRKPMTAEEAAIELDGKNPYLVYRDAESGGLSVIIVRDGGFDLIEGLG